MDRNKNFASDYCAQIEEYSEKGYIRKQNGTESEKEDHDP